MTKCFPNAAKGKLKIPLIMLITFYLNLMAVYGASPTNCSMGLSIVEIKYFTNIKKMLILNA